MSLINDALNRAGEAKPEPLSGLTPMSPVESQPRAGVRWQLPLLVVLLVVAAGCFIGMTRIKHTEPQVASKPAPAVAAPVSNPPPAVVATSPVAVATNAVPAPQLQPPLRLQAVVSDPVHPWAILDGKTVYPGCRAGDFLVKEISKNTVTLEAADGSQRQLSIGQ